VRKVLRGNRNFASPGVDDIATFWWKSFSSIHEAVSERLTEFVSDFISVLPWLVEGNIPKTGDSPDYMP
jgi:hypothetical protein